MALMLILAVCGIIALYTGAVGISATGNLRSVTTEAESDQARYAANGGIQAALYRLSMPVKRPGPGPDPDRYGEGVAWSDVDYYYRSDLTTMDSSTNPRIRALVQVYNNTKAAFHRTATTPDGTPIPDGRIFIIASGAYDNGEKKSSTTLGTLAKPLGLIFDQAAFGKSTVRLTDTLVDCTDSTPAGWTPAAYAPYDLTSAPLRGAGVASNNAIPNTVVLSNTKVDGNVTVGPSAPMGSIAYLAGSTQTGTASAFANAKDAGKPRAPAGTALLGGGGTVTYAGATSLPAGTWHVTGDLILNSATLTVTGPAVLYVDGKVEVTGSQLNMNRKPTDLQIYASGSDLKFNLSQACLLLAGADSALLFENTELFGGLIADSVDLRSSKVHYDQALGDKLFGSTDWVADSFLGRATTMTVDVEPADPSASPPAPAPAPSYLGTGPAPTPTPVPSPAAPPPEDPRPARCCMDFPCGPPMCHLF